MEFRTGDAIVDGPDRGQGPAPGIRFSAFCRRQRACGEKTGDRPLSETQNPRLGVDAQPCPGPADHRRPEPHAMERRCGADARAPCRFAGHARRPPPRSCVRRRSPASARRSAGPRPTRAASLCNPSARTIRADRPGAFAIPAMRPSGWCSASTRVRSAKPAVRTDNAPCKAPVIATPRSPVRWPCRIVSIPAHERFSSGKSTRSETSHSKAAVASWHRRRTSAGSTLNGLICSPVPCAAGFGPVRSR